MGGKDLINTLTLGLILVPRGKTANTPRSSDGVREWIIRVVERLPLSS